MSTDDLAGRVEIATTHLNPGDLVVFRLPPDYDWKDMGSLQRCVNALQATTLKEYKVLVLAQGVTVETIPAETLQRLGWVRAEEARVQ